MLLVVTLTLAKCKTSEKLSEKMSREKIVSGLHLWNHSCFGGRLIVAHLVHLLLISLTPKQLKLINNPLCYLTEQINIPRV